MSEITVDKFIGTNLRFKLLDSRVLEGVVTAIDPFGNVLLTNGWEFSADKLNSELHKREVGIISIPRESVVKVLADKKTHSKIFKI